MCVPTRRHIELPTDPALPARVAPTERRLERARVWRVLGPRAAQAELRRRSVGQHRRRRRSTTRGAHTRCGPRRSSTQPKALQQQASCLAETRQGRMLRCCNSVNQWINKPTYLRVHLCATLGLLEFTQRVQRLAEAASPAAHAHARPRCALETKAARTNSTHALRAHTHTHTCAGIPRHACALSPGHKLVDAHAPTRRHVARRHTRARTVRRNRPTQVHAR